MRRPHAATLPDSTPNSAAPPRPGTPGLPQQPAPGQEPQRPAWLKEVEGIETFDQDEREFIEQQAQGGMKHADIVRALDERRHGGAGAARGQGGAGVSGPAVPQPPLGGMQPPHDWKKEKEGIETSADNERKLVEGLAQQGAKRDEIVRQLQAFRAKRAKAAQSGEPDKIDRSEWLRDDLKSTSGAARDAAIKADPAIQKALAAGKITREDLIAHHLTPIEALRAFPFLFGGAADAGWRPDASGNLVLLPKNEDAQKSLTEALGGAARPCHDNPHDTWNRRRLAECAGIEADLRREGYVQGTPEYGKEAKRRLDCLD